MVSDLFNGSGNALAARPPQLGRLIACSAIVWILSVALAIVRVPEAYVVLRISVAALTGWFFVVLFRSASHALLISPLFLMAIANLAFYSLVPLIFNTMISGGWSWAVMAELTMRGSGGIAEALILQFAASCLFALSLVALVPPRNVETELGAWKSRMPSLFSHAAAAAVFLSLSLAAARWIPDLARLTASGIGREVYDALTPAISLALVTVALLGALGEPKRRIFAVAIILATTGLVSSASLAETQLYISLMALLVIGVVSPSLRYFLQLPALIAAVVLLGIIAVSLFRFDPSLRSFSAQFSDAVVRKVLLRQGVPMGCLENVAERHLNRHAGDPLYFVSGLVPRALWPEKPSLSRGSEFAATYCNNPEALKTTHSESITLLGEPVIEAGVWGLAVAQALLLLLLAGATTLLLRGSPLQMIAVIALSPWLIAFQQHFALYLANAVKMLLFMAPMLAILSFAARAAGQPSGTVRAARRVTPPGQAHS